MSNEIRREVVKFGLNFKSFGAFHQCVHRWKQSKLVLRPQALREKTSVNLFEAEKFYIQKQL
jgi:hypothetical protein